MLDFVLSTTFQSPLVNKLNKNAFHVSPLVSLTRIQANTAARVARFVRFNQSLPEARHFFKLRTREPTAIIKLVKKKKKNPSLTGQVENGG